MIIICAWCGKKISGNSGAISHGICLKCKDKLMKEIISLKEKIEKSETIDEIEGVEVKNGC